MTKALKDRIIKDGFAETKAYRYELAEVSDGGHSWEIHRIPIKDYDPDATFCDAWEFVCNA